MKFLYPLIILVLLVSCSKEQDLNKLNETFYVRNQGADMPVYMRGNVNSKVVILLLHGGPGGNGLEYRVNYWPIVLEENYAMAYWDQRGQGMSHGHYDKGSVTIDLMVNDMDVVIKTIKAKYGNDISVFALGHSWGGTLSAKYMITDGLQNNLKGWIEADGAHDNPKGAIEATKMFISVAEEQIALGNSVSNWTDILNWASSLDTNNLSDDDLLDLNQKGFEVEEWLIDDEVMNRGEKGGIETSPFTGPLNPLTSTITGIQTNKILEEETEAAAYTDSLHKVTIPVLALWGKYDFVVPSTLGDDTYNNVSSTSKKIVIFEKSGHSPLINEPDLFSNEIISFVEAHK